jgi:hypothetical protein
MDHLKSTLLTDSEAIATFSSLSDQNSSYCIFPVTREMTHLAKYLPSISAVAFPFKIEAQLVWCIARLSIGTTFMVIYLLGGRVEASGYTYNNSC